MLTLLLVMVTTLVFIFPVLSKPLLYFFINVREEWKNSVGNFQGYKRVLHVNYQEKKGNL